MLIIEIALGIVLAVLILRYLTDILAFGVVAIGIGIVLAIAVGIIYFLYLAANSDELHNFLTPIGNIVGLMLAYIITPLFFLGVPLVLYKSSLEVNGSTTGSCIVSPQSRAKKKTPPTIFMFLLSLWLLLWLFIFRIAAPPENSWETIVITVLVLAGGVILPAILLLLRAAVRFGIPHKLGHFAQKIPPQIMLWLGFKSKNHNLS